MDERKVIKCRTYLRGAYIILVLVVDGLNRWSVLGVVLQVKFFCDEYSEISFLLNVLIITLITLSPSLSYVVWICPD